MNDERIHAFLDGDLPRESLTRDELARATELQHHIDAAAESVRAAPVPDLAARVMAELPDAAPTAIKERAARERSATSRAASWFWRPRTLTIAWRPAYAAVGGFAVVLLLLIGMPAGQNAPFAPTAASEEAATPTVYVQFRLDAPGAQRVDLAGSFTGWSPAHELHETAPGVWTVVVPLIPGVHDYTFVVDGERWIVDPNAPAVEDDFGGSNSRLFLPSPVQGA